MAALPWRRAPDGKTSGTDVGTMEFQLLFWQQWLVHGEMGSFSHSPCDVRWRVNFVVGRRPNLTCTLTFERVAGYTAEC